MNGSEKKPRTVLQPAMGETVFWLPRTKIHFFGLPKLSTSITKFVPQKYFTHVQDKTVTYRGHRITFQMFRYLLLVDIPNIIRVVLNGQEMVQIFSRIIELAKDILSSKLMYLHSTNNVYSAKRCFQLRFSLYLFVLLFSLPQVSAPLHKDDHSAIHQHGHSIKTDHVYSSVVQFI